MKPVPAIIAPERIFYIRKIKQPYFSNEFHYHEQCQLAYIIKGSGKRIVGDSVEHFDENELVFIGSNLPHVWYTEASKEGRKPKSSISLSLFISPEDFLNHLSSFGETEKIKDLFKRAQNGMFITGQTRARLIALLKKAAAEHDGLERIVILFTIINILSTTNEYVSLARSNYVNYFLYRENERMDHVYRYLMANFKREISLAEVAGIAAMSPNAFCRFFKSRTQKSLMQFINEIRIGHACKLLSQPDESITHIAYECGYNNVSNFNRFFKIIKGTTPRYYRKQLQ